MKLKLLFAVLALAPLLTACPPTPLPTFTFSLDPTAGSAAPGGNTITTATITPQHGFLGEVAFSLAAPPAGITLTGGPATVTGAAPVTADLTIAVAAAVAAGDYPLTVEATGGGLTRTATFTLTVPPPALTGISGYVTNANAGEPVSGSRIEVRNTGTTTVVATVTTDAGGRYSVDLPAGTYDLVLSRAGYAGSKVIGAMVGAPREPRLHLNIVQFRAFNPNWPTTPPAVTVGQVDEGEVFDFWGFIPFSVTAEPANPLGTHVIYAALGHTPGARFATGERAAWFGTNSTGQQYLDPWDYAAQGDTTFQVVVYDYNFNRTHVIRNIRVTTPFFEHADLVAPRARGALAVTTSKQIEFLAAPAGGNLWVELTWLNVEDFSKLPNDWPFGCRVYRSFDGVNFHHLRTLAAWDCGFFRDSSADLAVGRKTYYRIINFVGNQESEPSNVVTTTPLPAWDVRLTAPADNAQNVSVTPTFTWTPTARVGAHQYYVGVLWDTLSGESVTLANWAQFPLVDQTSWTWNQDGVFNGTQWETLQRGRSYEWQLLLAYALDHPTNPTAVSIAADGWLVESTDFFTFTTAP